MSSIQKNGIILSKEFDESEAMYITKNGKTSYVPNTGTNSCMNSLTVRFDYTGTTVNTVYRIIAKVSQSGFDTSNTSGTFNMQWQGSNYNTANAAWEQKGTNYICSALSNQYNVKNLVLSATSGSYTYDTTFTLPQGFRDTWSGSQVGFRADYSNGTGRITVNEIMVLPDAYSFTGSVKAHFSDDYIACGNIVEI